MEVMEVIDDFLLLLQNWRKEMPTQKLKLTETEDQEHRARLMRLKKLGIPIGCADDPSPEPDRLTVEQIQPWIRQDLRSAFGCGRSSRACQDDGCDLWDFDYGPRNDNTVG